MQSKLVSHFFKFKAYFDDYKKLIVSGAIVWLGIFIVGFGLVTLKSNGIVYKTYASAETVPSAGMKIISNDFKQKRPFTLVLYRDDCSACKEVEERLMKDYSLSKNSSKHDYIILNVNELSTSQKQTLIKKIPQITLYGDKIPTPLVANVKPISSKKAIVPEISKDNDPKLFEPVFKHSKNLEVTSK